MGGPTGVGSAGVGGVAAGPATAGGAGAEVERGEGGAGATPETKGGTGVTRGIAKGQGQGLEAAAEAVEELLICRPLDVPHYLDWNICSPSTYTLARFSTLEICRFPDLLLQN